MRHLIIIIAVILTYCAPNNSEGVQWFVDQSKISTIFVLFLYLCQYIKYQSHLNYIISIEILSTITNLIACGQYAMAHKTAFIYFHYEHIMSAMFLAELAIIMGVVIRDVGNYFKHSSIHLTIWNSATVFFSGLFINKAHLCKNP